MYIYTYVYKFFNPKLDWQKNDSPVRYDDVNSPLHVVQLW